MLIKNKKESGEHTEAWATVTGTYLTQSDLNSRFSTLFQTHTILKIFMISKSMDTAADIWTLWKTTYMNTFFQSLLLN